MGACEWLTETKLNLRNSWRWLENVGQCQRIGEFPIILCRIGDKDLIARRLPFTWQISTTNSASLICKPHWLVDLHWEFIRYLQTLKIDYFPTLNIVRFCMVSLGTLLLAPTSISWQATESKHSPAPPIKSRYLIPPPPPFCDSPFWINKQAHERESHLSSKLALLLPAAGEWSVPTDI